MFLKRVYLRILLISLALIIIPGFSLHAQKKIPTDSLKLWFRADKGVKQSDSKVTQWDDQSGSNLHAKLFRGQPMFLKSAIGGKPAIHFNGKGDVLEFKGWSPNGLTAMTTIIVSANTEFQPEPYEGGWDEGGHCGTLQSVLNWPEQPGSPPHAWGNVILSPFQKSVSYRFGTGQLSNSNHWKRPASIGDSPTMTMAVHDGATEKLYVEGELVFTQTDKFTTIKNTASNGFIGRWSHGGDNSGWFAGNVAEIIVYAKALDDTERKQVEDYLKEKYFSSLTANAADQKEVEMYQTSYEIDVNINSKPFTTYIYKIDPIKRLAAEGVLLSKPVLYPLRTPSGIKVTRGWPFEKIEGESQDHPHHMGLYFTYDIPGNSFWNNSTQSLPVISQVNAQITRDPHGNQAIQSLMQWIDEDSVNILTEKRLTSFIAGVNQNIIDFDIELQAVADKVEFGVTKEGMFAIRLAQWLTEGSGTGAYLSSNGDEKEKGVWGKRAEWVRIQGEYEGRIVGIAILNHPTSTNYPTYWHARGYGCFSANPLGQSAFDNSLKVENSKPYNLILRKGETAPFRFRVIIYDSPRTKQQLDQEYQKYVK